MGRFVAVSDKNVSAANYTESYSEKRLELLALETLAVVLLDWVQFPNGNLGVRFMQR